MDLFTGLILAYKKKSSGFTLIEVLVSLVIAIASITIILTHVRTLFDMSLRLKEQEQQTRELLNNVAAFRLTQINNLQIEQTNEQTLSIKISELGKSNVWVKNFNQLDEIEVPIIFSYTPYQEYTIAIDSGKQFTMILKGLEPPQ